MTTDLSTLHDEALRLLGNDYHLELGKNIELDGREKKLEKILVQLTSEPSIRQKLKDEIDGLGPLKYLIQDETITEILIQGTGEIWVEKQGSLEKHTQHFVNTLSYENFIHRISQDAKLPISIDRPFADGNWRQFRAHLIGPPLSTGFQLSFRRHPERKWTLDRLQNSGWANEKNIQLIKGFIDRKKSILIVGATGSGKTSVLNACLERCHPNERVVVIEDTPEITLPNSVSTKLLTRVDYSGVLKNYDQTDLVRQSLRMRPDRLVIGEVRGSEAKDLLMALSTGHSGGICTLHAESARQALIRLEMMIQLGAPQWSLKAIRHLIFFGIQYVICAKKENGQRMLSSIHQLTSIEDSGFCLDQLY